MPEPTLYGLFIVAALALLLVPGPAVLYIVASTIEGGRRAGLVSTVGIHCGSLVHVAAAALGLSSLLVSSARAFEIVKYAGAAYLIVLGLRTVFARPGAPPALATGRDLGRRLTRAATVQILNPKTALFFLAFLPQFVDPNGPAPAAQLLVLGLTFVLLGLVSDGAYAVIAGTVAPRLRRTARAASAGRWASGGILVGLGLTAALTGSRRTA